MYALTYTKTVETYPKSIFVLATVILYTAVAITGFVDTHEPEVAYTPLAEEEPQEEHEERVDASVVTISATPVVT